MEKTNILKAIRATGILLSVVLLGRQCVSLGRWVYAWYTNTALPGYDALPQPLLVVAGDPYLYLGLAAVAIALVAGIRLRKTHKIDECHRQSDDLH